jgi:adenine-specific DNA-methyltransferase
MKINKSNKRNKPFILNLGDTHLLLEKIPDKSIDLTITSPPYCMGKEYETTTKTSDFIKNHKMLLPEIIRKTKEGGSICWQVGYHVKNGSITPLDFLIHNIMSEFSNMYLRNRIIWSYGHGLHAKKRFSGRHETVLWYTKGEEYKFNLDKIRIPQKYPGKRHYKGEKKGQFSGNPLGKNPSDVWEIPNVNAHHVEKTEHPCQFPIALAQRFIRALTPDGGLVFDPFLGSGTTAVAAILENKRFIGSEINKNYYKIAKIRCREAINGKINYRPLDKPVIAPDLRTEVAQKPKSFI